MTPVLLTPEQGCKALVSPHLTTLVELLNVTMQSLFEALDGEPLLLELFRAVPQHGLHLLPAGHHKLL